MNELKKVESAPQPAKPKGNTQAEKQALFDATEAIQTMKRMAAGLLPETIQTLTALANREGCQSDDAWDVLKHFRDKV